MSAQPPITEIRCSALPLARLCPGSLVPIRLRVEEHRQESVLGTAVHAILRTLAETGQVAWSLVDGVAQRYGVSREEIGFLCRQAEKMWKELSPSFPEALTEVALSHHVSETVVLTGHADVLSIGGRAARLGDWKTGRKDTDYRWQMQGYAALVLLNDRQLEEATSTILWLRDAQIETYTMQRHSLVPWLGELDAEIVRWDGVYRAGHHCKGCPRSHECEPVQALVRRDVAMFSKAELAEHVEAELAHMPPAEILDLYRRADLVRYFAERVRGAIRAHIVANGGALTAEGVELYIQTEKLRELDPLLAWPVLAGAFGFGDAEFAQCIDLHPSDVDRVVAKKAGRGKGAAAVRELAKKLEEAGAVSTRDRISLRERRG